MSRADATDNVARRLVAEFLGTAFLLMAIVGSGIMGTRLMGGNDGMTLLAISITTASTLMVMIFAFGPISGAHLNPAVTLCVALRTRLPWRLVPMYIAAQILGALVGVGIVHMMFELSLVQLSNHGRGGLGQGLSEFIATFGLLTTIWGVARLHSLVTPLAVAAYILAAFWFTASTCFANPAVTIARAFTVTLTGIHYADIPLFLVAQVLGALAATGLFAWLIPDAPAEHEVVVEHEA